MARFRLLLSLLAIGIIGLTGFLLWPKSHPSAAPTLNYSVAPVTRGDIRRTVMTTGQLAPLVSVEVSTQISGQITEVLVDFNSPVKKGDVLARIDLSTYQQKLNQAKADLAAAEANHALAQLKADRQQKLLGQSMVMQQDYDEASAQLQQAQATLLTRRAAVENAQLDLDRCTLTSPIDGIVIYKSADVGKTVQASFSAPTLFVIAEDLRRMQIIAAINEVDIWSVHPGQPVSFTVDALPNTRFTGHLKHIRNPYTPSEKQSNTPATNTITTFDAVIEVDNPDLLLLPSLTANVSIIVAEKTGVLRVPNSALRVAFVGSVAPPPAPVDGKPHSLVYRLPAGDRTATPEPIWVETGLADNFATEILSGLSAGDTVITGVSHARESRGRLGLF